MSDEKPMKFNPLAATQADLAACRKTLFDFVQSYNKLVQERAVTTSENELLQAELTAGQKTIIGFAQTYNQLLRSYIALKADNERLRAELDRAKLLRQTGERPKVVCLCGSIRFMKEFEEAEFNLTLSGIIVLTVGCNAKVAASDFDWSRYKPMLDELHKRKIDLADEVFVLNVGGYIGDSTRSEIAYALNHKIPVAYLETMEGCVNSAVPIPKPEAGERNNT